MSNNVPKIRFKGYSEAWEQRKLSDVCEVLDGDRGKHYPSGNDFITNGHTLFLNAGNVTKNGFSFDEVQYITEQKSQSLGNGKVIVEDILLTSRGSLGNTAYYNEKIHALFPFLRINSGMLILRTRDRLTSIYLSQYLKSPLGKKQIDFLSFGSAQPQLTKKDVCNYKIKFSSVEEQEKIGRLFETLDETIALHQRKLDLLKQLKTAYLQQLFPQNDENVPQLRFADFGGEWEQRKFSEIYSYLQNNTLSRAELNYNSGKIMNVHYGDVLIKFSECLDVKKYKLPFVSHNFMVVKYDKSYLKNGDMIIADTAEDESVGKCCELINVSDEKVLSGLHTIPCRPMYRFSTGYLGYYMNSASYRCQLRPLMQGVKVTSISKASLANTYIDYPQALLEQSAIGKFFRKLDTTINTHQEKLDKLKILKHQYLKNMFV